MYQRISYSHTLIQRILIIRLAPHTFRSRQGTLTRGTVGSHTIKWNLFNNKGKMWNCFDSELYLVILLFLSADSIGLRFNNAMYKTGEENLFIINFTKRLINYNPTVSLTTFPFCFHCSLIKQKKIYFTCVFTLSKKNIRITNNR